MFKELNILKLFFESPQQEFNVREAAKLLSMAPATVSKALKRFAKANILKYRKERMLDLYRADMDSDGYRDLKIYYTLRKIRESGLIHALNEFYLMPTIILFGSSAHGYDRETSDIDLVVISEGIKDFPDKERYEKKLHQTLHIFSVKNLKELKNVHLINNVLNGIVLQGELRWI